MAEFKVNLRTSNGEGGVGWINIAASDSTVYALENESGSTADGWSIQYDATRMPALGTNGITDPLSGDAAIWVTADAARDCHGAGDGEVVRLLLTGPANAGFEVEAYAGIGSTGRITDFSGSNGTSATLTNTGNVSETVTFTGQLDGNGDGYIDYERNASSTGNAYANALKIITVEAQNATFTLSSTDIFPNSSVSGTGTNYGGMPSVLTMFDGSGNTFSSSGVSFPDLSFTGSASSFSFDATTPSKPAEGESASWIKYGAITINITDPGA